jgi:hypothetical protein
MALTRSTHFPSILREILVSLNFRSLTIFSLFQKALLSLVKRHGDLNSALDEQPEAEQAIEDGVR